MGNSVLRQRMRADSLTARKRKRADDGRAVARCIAEGLVDGHDFAVDASLIRADVHRQRSVPGEQGLPPEAVGRAGAEYLEMLDDARARSGERR